MRRRIRWGRIGLVTGIASVAMLGSGGYGPLPPGWDAVTLCYPIIGPIQRFSPSLSDTARVRIQAHEDVHRRDCLDRGALGHYAGMMLPAGRLAAEARANCAEARQQVAAGRLAYLEVERVVDDLRYGYPWFRKLPDSVLRQAIARACPDVADAVTPPPWQRPR